MTEREALACVWAVEKWGKYLWGKPLSLQVDQAALKTLMTSAGVGRARLRIARWASHLMAYDFKVEYVMGRPIQLTVCPDSRRMKTPKQKMVL